MTKPSRGKIGKFCSKEKRWIWYDKEDIADYRAKMRENPVAPSIRCDTMDAMKHPKTGQWTDSKSHFDAISKATGCIPWDPPKDWNANGIHRELNDKELKEIEEDIDQAARRAYNELTWGQLKMSEDQKHFAKEVNEKFETVTGKTPKLAGGLD